MSEPSKVPLGKKIKLAKSKLQLSLDNGIKEIMSAGLSDAIVEWVEKGYTKGWWSIGLIEGEDYEGIVHDALCSGLIQHLGHEGVEAEISYSIGCSDCWEIGKGCMCSRNVSDDPGVMAYLTDWEGAKDTNFAGKYQSLTILKIKIR